MLKFSGSADLHSCQTSMQNIKLTATLEANAGSTTCLDLADARWTAGLLHCTDKVTITCWHRFHSTAQVCLARSNCYTLGNWKTLSQAGFQEFPKSAICIQMVIWFPEFCKSQCISHFAAPFLNVRAKTSVTESWSLWRTTTTTTTTTTQELFWYLAEEQCWRVETHTIPHCPRVLHHWLSWSKHSQR